MALTGMVGETMVEEPRQFCWSDSDVPEIECMLSGSCLTRHEGNVEIRLPYLSKQMILDDDDDDAMFQPWRGAVWQKFCCAGEKTSSWTGRTWTRHDTQTTRYLRRRERNLKS